MTGDCLMAGDKPTPKYNNKEGTPFEDGTHFDLHLAGETLLSPGVVTERRRVEEALSAIAATAHDLKPESSEIILPLRSPIDAAAIGKELLKARLFQMDPGDALAKWDEAA